MLAQVPDVTRQDLIFKLVTTSNLNVPERLALGWDSKVSVEEVKEVVRNVLNEHRYFPGNARPGVMPEGVFEGCILERLGDGRVRLVCQRPYATNPNKVAESMARVFEDVESALDRYIELEWKDSIAGVLIKYL